MTSDVAPDGSPVDVYLALPPGDTPRTIDSALRPRSSILELGSGPGRISHPLAELGHTVVAVDNSPEMLAHLRDVEGVLADVFSLDLRRTFDGVVAGSNLINIADHAMRIRLLEVCRRHVADGGSVLVERYEPEWASAPTASRATIGHVEVAFELVGDNPDSFRGRVVYSIGRKAWVQEFTATHVPEDVLVEDAASAGLTFDGWLDAQRTWARLSPVP